MKIDPQHHCINYEESVYWAMLHDVLAHPLMAITFYSCWSIKFHDYTSSKAWDRSKEK